MNVPEVLDGDRVDSAFDEETANVALRSWIRTHRHYFWGALTDITAKTMAAMMKA